MAGRIVGSVDAIIAMLQQEAGHSVKTVNDGMEQAMLEVQKQAKARAPYEHGNLEDAIKISNLGQRRGWIVGVDESMPDDTGKYTVGDYAMEMHEGQYNLGEASEQKAAANGQPVGRKFLEAPFQEAIDHGLVDELQTLLTNELDRRK